MTLPFQLERENVTQQYDTVAEAQAAASNLASGNMVTTQGYSSAGDNGGNVYRVVDGTTTYDGGFYIDLDGSRYLEAINKQVVHAAQFGLTADGVTDESATFQSMLDAVGVQGGTVSLHSNGSYEFNFNVVAIGQSGINVIGNNAVILNGQLSFAFAVKNCTWRDLKFKKMSTGNIGGQNYQGIALNTNENIHLSNMRFEVEGGIINQNSFYMYVCKKSSFKDFYFGPNAGACGVFTVGEDIQIDNWECDYAQNDDFLALKAAIGVGGCKNWQISNCLVKGAFAGISIGSQAAPEEPMENIIVTNLVCVDTTAVAYIKCGYNVASGASIGGYWRNIVINGFTYRSEDPEVISPSKLIEFTIRERGTIDGVQISNGTIHAKQRGDGSPASSSVIAVQSWLENDETCTLKNVKVSDIIVADSDPVDFWQASTAYTTGDEIRQFDLGDSLEYNWTSNSDRTSGATWDATEQVNWTRGPLAARSVRNLFIHEIIPFEGGTGTPKIENMQVDGIQIDSLEANAVGNLPGQDVIFRNISLTNPSINPLGADATRSILMGPDTAEVQGFRINNDTLFANIVSDPQTYQADASKLPGPRYNDNSFIATSPVALPSWTPIERFFIGTFSITSSSNDFTLVLSKINKRASIFRMNWLVTSAITASDAAYVTMTVYKQTAGGRRPIARRTTNLTDGFAIPADTMTPMFDGIQVPEWAFQTYQGIESWIDYDDQLEIDFAWGAGEVTFENLEFSIHYLEC